MVCCQEAEMDNLIGLGLYTIPEASRLVGVPGQRIRRWLKGHSYRGKVYEPLWEPEVPDLNGKTFVSFRDLMEIRIANRLIQLEISSQKVRAAILVAREVTGQDHPLSTNRFRTDGRNIFLHLIQQDETGEDQEALLNLLKKQYAFEKLLAPLLASVDFTPDGAPRLWWPRGRSKGIVVDPARAFGQPIDVESSVPTAVLAGAGQVEGIKRAASLYAVTERAVRRAMAFEQGEARAAA